MYYSGFSKETEPIVYIEWKGGEGEGVGEGERDNEYELVYVTVATGKSKICRVGNLETQGRADVATQVQDSLRLSSLFLWGFSVFSLKAFN